MNNQAEARAWAHGSTATPTTPPAKTRGLQLLTESRQKTQRRCQREEQLRYQLGYVPCSSSDALRFGALFHFGLEAWWLATVDRLAAGLAAFAEHASEGLDQFELVRAEELLRGYDARWGDESYETIAVEAEFRTPLVNPESNGLSKTFERAGKIDVIAYDPTRRKVIVEHKTSGEDISSGSSYWARLRMDGQVSGYFRGAESLGHAVEECLYDVIGKVGLKPYKATPLESRKYLKSDPTKLHANQRERDETPEEYRARVREHIATHPDDYYQRAPVVRLESEMRAYDLETWQQAVQMRDAQRLGIAPRNPDACTRFGSVCGYFDVCSGAAALDDESRFKRLAWAHPELTQPSKEETEHG